MANGKSGHKGMSYTRYGYLFVAPFVIVYCVFSLYPLLNTFWYSTAKMDTSIASFWGFGDLDVYYDRYLDLGEAYDGDKFKDAVGCTKGDYNKIKGYFSIQDNADMNKPLDEKGVNAIIDNGANDKISDKTINELKDCLANGDMSYLSEDAVKELKDWNDAFTSSNDESTLLGKIKEYSVKLTAATTVEESEESSEPITAEAITGADNFAKFIETLEANEFDENQVALINYLAEKTGKASLVEYFKAAQSGEVKIEDPMFYYVVATLSAPNAVATDAEGNVANIAAVAVPFQADLEAYLKANAWSDAVSSVSSVAKLDSYIDGTATLHTDEEALYADIATLDSMGLIQAQLLEVKDGKIVESADKSSKDNFLPMYRNYIDTKAETKPGDAAASRQIYSILNYCSSSGNAARANLLSAGIKVDSFISFTGKLDVKKYLAFKEEIGLKDVLTYDNYKKIDAAKREDNKAKSEKKLADFESKLDAAESEFNAAEAAYVAAGSVDKDAEGKSTPEYKEYISKRNTYSDIVTGISTSKSDIKNPKGILTKVDSSKEYICVGLDNFAQIFGNQTRMNVVIGSFVSTAIMWIIGFIPQIALALLLSAWFTDTKLHLKGLNAMKALMYLPNVITAATIAIFFRRLFSYSTGGTLSAAQQVRALFGAKPYDFYGNPWATRFIVCFINFWMWYGNTMIVLISGITSINESIYESAQLDGANSFQTYTKITLPLLRPILLYTMVTSLIGGLQMYDIPMNLNMNPAIINFNGTFIKSSQTVLMYVNDQAFGKQSVKQVGIAAAVSIILFAVTTVLSVIIFYLMRDKDAAKAKKVLKKGGTK